MVECPKCGKEIKKVVLIPGIGEGYAVLVHTTLLFRGITLTFEEQSGCTLSREEWENYLEKEKE